MISNRCCIIWSWLVLIYLLISGAAANNWEFVAGEWQRIAEPSVHKSTSTQDVPSFRTIPVDDLPKELPRGGVRVTPDAGRLVDLLGQRPDIELSRLLGVCRQHYGSGNVSVMIYPDDNKYVWQADKGGGASYSCGSSIDAWARKFVTLR